MLLVTGLDGLLSSSMIRSILDSGQDLVVLTRQCLDATSFPHPVIVADLLNPEQVKACLSGRKFEGVFHVAAAMDGVSDHQVDHFGGYINSVMTNNLLEALGPDRVDKFVLVSSIDVYDPAAFSSPVTETAKLKPATDYGKSKLESELRVQKWSQQYGVPTLILRVTQVFGAKDRTRKFIPSVIRKIKSGLPVEVFGEGDDLRDYLYCHDFARLAMQLYQKNADGIFNLATGVSQSLNEVLEAIVRVSGKEVAVNYHQRTTQKLDYRFDNSKLIETVPDFKFTEMDRALHETYVHLF